MKKIILLFFTTLVFTATPTFAATWKPATPADYTPISWVKAPGVASFFKAPSGNGSLDFITRIHLPENQIQFIAAKDVAPLDWGVSNSASFTEVADQNNSAFHNFAFARLGAEAAKGVSKAKFIWNGPFFNVTALTSDLSLAIKTAVGTTTLISSGSRPDNDIAKPRRSLLINNKTGTATIADFDEAQFVKNTSDVALEGFAPTVVLSDSGAGVSARLFLGVSKDKKELVVYCSQGATVGEASDQLVAAGVPTENQLEADGGGSATCGYTLPGQYFVEPTRTLPLLMGAITVLGHGYPTTDGLNVRSGAGAKFASVKKLKKTEAITIYEEKSGWYRIGDSMWVSKTLIKKSS